VGRAGADSLLDFADELERRDADVSGELARVEALQREVEDVRTRGAAVDAFLAALPVARGERAADERAASTAVEEARVALGEARLEAEQARDDAARLAADRAVAQAEDGVRAADRWVDQARTASSRLEREATARGEEAEEVEVLVQALAARVRHGPPPDAGLDGALEWAARARGGLLLERSGLAREREDLVREATELLASVLGEDARAASVADVRGRLERALGPN